ncbi:MAG: hypothetical protein LBP62_06590 [Clostridiales bacterium]|nr:hypothetical protein [Clostridiales bacterium]
MTVIKMRYKKCFKRIVRGRPTPCPSHGGEYAEMNQRRILKKHRQA